MTLKPKKRWQDWIFLQGKPDAAYYRAKAKGQQRFAVFVTLALIADEFLQPHYLNLSVQPPSFYGTMLIIKVVMCVLAWSVPLLIQRDARRAEAENEAAKRA